MIYEHYDTLYDMVYSGYVNVEKHPIFDYYIYNYNQHCQFDRIWNPATIDARGLILDPLARIIARPFRKFFNIQEHGSDGNIPYGMPFTTQEKMDGSLGIQYTGEDGNPYIATRGSFVSDQAIHATKLLQLNYDVIVRNAGFHSTAITYLYEIIYPANRVVINYGALDAIVPLGAIDMATGEYYYPDEVHRDIDNTFERVPQIYTVDTVAELLSHVKDDFEGYVVRYSNGFTMKVKLDEYVRLHKLMTNLTNVDIWDCLSNGDDIGSILNDVPDEYFNIIQQTMDSLNEEFIAILGDANTTLTNLPGTSKKDDAIAMQDYVYKHVVFAIKNGKNYEKVIWDIIKPKYRIKLCKFSGDTDV